MLPLRQSCLYFGTFNPIHWGHLMIAQSALRQFGEAFGFERVIFIPAGNPPHRSDESDMLDAALRLKMVQLAVGDNPRFQASDLELTLPGKSYTVETLRFLWGNQQIVSPTPLIIGSDALAGLASWHEPEALIASAHFLQAPRPGVDFVTSVQIQGKTVPLNTSAIEMPPLGISSSWVRTALKTHGPDAVRYALPEPVRAFIRQNTLYACKQL